MEHTFLTGSLVVHQLLKKRLDVADALIAHKARYVADEGGQALEGFYSFDKAVEQLEGAKTPWPELRVER